MDNYENVLDIVKSHSPLSLTANERSGTIVASYKQSWEAQKVYWEVLKLGTCDMWCTDDHITIYTDRE